MTDLIKPGTNGKLRPCCRNLKNREPPVEAGDELTYERCSVCGRRHFELRLRPGRLGIRGG